MMLCAVGDYVYLVERDRRWFSSAYLHGVVSPFLSPVVISASFALTAADKRRWAPASRVASPVSCRSGPRCRSCTAPTPGPPPRRPCGKCVAGASAGRNAALLRQFTYLAVPTRTLQPDAVRKVRPTTYRALTGQPQSVLARVAARPMRFVRRSRVGRQVWTAVRSRLLR